MEYAAIVRDKALLRGVAQAAAEITAMVAGGRGRAPPKFWRRRSRRFTPSAGARAAQDMVPLRQVLPEVLDRLGEMSRERESPAGALHGYVRRWTRRSRA